jgi:hypothetical protein
MAGPFQRPFGTCGSDPAARHGKTSLSRRRAGGVRRTKRPTEAGKRTTPAFLENKSKSCARCANGQETPPEMMRVRLLEGSRNHVRRHASGRRFQRGTFQRKRADDIQTMGHETTKTDAHATPPPAAATLLFPTVCATPRAESRLATAPREPTPGSSSCARHDPTVQRRRWKQQLWSKKSSCARVASVPSAQRSLIRKPPARNRVHPTPRTARAPLRRASIALIALHMTRHCIRQHCLQPCSPQPCSPRSRGGRQPGSIQLRSDGRAAARVPRKLLRVQCLSDKLGYLRAAFLSPSIFLHQP